MRKYWRFATPAIICPVPLAPGVASLAEATSNLENVKSMRGAMGSALRFKRAKPWPLKPVLNASFASLTGTETPPPRPKLTSRLDPMPSVPPICARATGASAMTNSATDSTAKRFFMTAPSG